MTPVRNKNQPLCRYSRGKAYGTVWVKNCSFRYIFTLAHTEQRRTIVVDVVRACVRVCVCVYVCSEQRQRVKVIYRSPLSAVHTKNQFTSGVEPANSVALNFLDSAGTVTEIVYIYIGRRQ